MKCKKCGEQAAINMRQHRLGLCAPHYVEWIRAQTERFITKYKMFSRDARVLVAVSGGKDSLALWDVLLGLGYRVDGLYIGLGIDGGIDYSNQSLARIETFLTGREDVRLHVVDVREQYGAGIPRAARLTLRGKNKPCSVCGLVKRHVMNRVAMENGYDVLATGHNLDDEAAVLFGNTMQWQVGYLARQAPVLPASGEGLARKVKPFCRFYERETAAYTIIRGIDYIYDECPYSVGASSIRYKTALNELERESVGAKLHFYLGFLRAREAGMFSGVEEARPDLRPCNTCGQPTTAGDQCAFCRLWVKVGERS
jgi:uncharacterized protein (TIGR00269 family)